MNDELTIGAWLDLQTELFPHEPALFSADDGRVLDFSALNQKVSSLTRSLGEVGIGSGGVTIVALPNNAEILVLLLALMQVTAVLPVHYAIADQPLMSLIEKSGATAIMGAARQTSAVWRVAEALNLPYVTPEALPGEFGAFSLAAQRPRPPERNAIQSIDDPALYIATSGTTGQSKIVAITQRSLDQNIATHGRLNTYGPGTRALCVMPFTYLFAYVRSSLPMLRTGGAVGIAPGYRFKDVQRWCEKLRPTCMAATPTILKKFIADANAAGWRPDEGILSRFHSTGEAIPDDLRGEIFTAFGATLATNYGMTETSPQVAVSLPEDELPPGVAGRVVSPWQVSILDDCGQSLPAGQIGRVALKGGYVNAIVEMEEENRLDSKGRLLTGDRGFLDEKSVLHLAGRVDDVINRGGEKIDPRPIELALEQNSDIEQAVVFGLPDPAFGQKVWAIVKLKEGTSLNTQAIKTSAADLITGWSMPEKLISVTEIPVNENGKISRRDLAAQYSRLPDNKDAS